MTEHSDRELLEQAAKAAGIAYEPALSTPHPISGAWWGLWLAYDREPNEFDRRYWNALTDDGDRYRLAQKLRINIDFADCCAWTRLPDGTLIQEFWGGEHGDEAHAIVRAAAALGRAEGKEEGK